ncbi:DUF6247 family protein [Streptomonospora algeriensis]|uniref:DUF6247 family protein n=1 Tax=Streptomonospora algeriensis TaxID=995084 RepID=A0ABW3BAQ9_9ACTN
MTEQYSEGSEAALIPRPAETPAALRRAVARILPSRLKEFDGQLLEASTEAQELMDIGPLRVFCYRWSRVIEIERYPVTARRLAELEHIVGTGHPDTGSAVKETSRILRDADAALGR